MNQGSIPETRLGYEAERTLRRIKPDLEGYFRSHPSPDAESRWRAFDQRLDKHWSSLFRSLYALYGHLYDFHYHLEQILHTAAEYHLQRPAAMMELDQHRLHDPLWYRSNGMVGCALYVDLADDNLPQLQKRIGYFSELGITYLHLMPLFTVREGDNDGGYAINDYRSVKPELGTIEDLQGLASKLRESGISLVLDFVFNHTSDDHAWAHQAKSGDPEYEEYYFMYADRVIPDQYDRTLREIFPTVRRGCFSWHDDVRKWVWTTFNDFQWDLRYANPMVFCAMLGEMLFLSNLGVEILRFDAIAFIWKQLGTLSENLPQTHVLIRAFNALARIAAPGLIFKSEAIVHPDEVLRYIDERECQLSYNPLLMALIWESVATRKTDLLRRSIEGRHNLPDGCAWCNYLRGHDDIGWTFDDNDAWRLGIDPYRHRRFLNDFYTGQFDGSFAKGVPFQFNPDTGDMRVSGTLASLAGIEQALESGNQLYLGMAIRRILMMHSVILTIGGIPLMYLGDEWGLTNDYSYRLDPDKAGDSRWVHRQRIPWHLLNVDNHDKWETQLFTRLKALIHLRKRLPALNGVNIQLMETGSPHLLAYQREHSGSRLLVIHNFSDRRIDLDCRVISAYEPGQHFVDHISDNAVTTFENLWLAPYQFLWLERD
jgi:amylosucrase